MRSFCQDVIHGEGSINIEAKLITSVIFSYFLEKEQLPSVKDNIYFHGYKKDNSIHIYISASYPVLHSFPFWGMLICCRLSYVAATYATKRECNRTGGGNFLIFVFFNTSLKIIPLWETKFLCFPW